jgi:uncharacterized protein (DUF58 family)
VIRINRRALGIFGGAGLLFLMATNIQSGWLFVLSSLLLGAVVGGIAVPISMVRGLRVERRAPPEAFVGDEVPVDLIIENQARGSRLSIAIGDPHIAPTSAFLPTIRAGERIGVHTVRLATRRGVMDQSPVELASTAPFGLARARVVVPASGRTVIFPRVVPLGRLQFLERAATRSMPLGQSSRRGEGDEFLGVREYRYGDSLRNVHWPSTARRGALVVREMEYRTPASVAILVDTWTDAGEEETALDLSCTVAASTAVAALADGHEVLLAAAQLGVAGPPVSMDRREALTWLAGLAAPGGQQLAAVIEQAAPSWCSAALIVVPTWRPNGAAALRPPVAELIRRGASVIVAVIDASGFGARAATLGPAEMKELDLALNSVGAEVRHVDSLDDLASGLGRSIALTALGASP